MRRPSFTLIQIVIAALACAPAFAQGVRTQASAEPPAPAAVKVEAPKAASDGGPGLAVDSNFVLGAEDVITLTVWREPEFSGVKLIRPDGKISVSLAGDIQAAGLTPLELTKSVTERLSEWINRPEVNIAVNQINSKKFYIQGQVNRPGQYPLAVPIKVGDALSAAGGFKDFANTKDIIIMRGEKRLKFNWNDFIKAKKLEQNIYLENGDTIVVK